MEDLISIIVPVYNVQGYLSRCLDSILRQSYTNLEIIIVDDGSTDNSWSIINEYKNKDKRIIAINKTNGGLSDARNCGLALVSGKYLCFIDSDDYVNNDFVKILHHSIVSKDSDISVCSYQRFDSLGKYDPPIKKAEETLFGYEAIVDIFTSRQNTEVMMCNKMFKASLFKNNDIVFPFGKINEDNLTIYKLYYFAQSITVTNLSLYFYFKRSNSITNNISIIKTDILDNFNEVIDFFKSHNEWEKYRTLIINYYLLSVVSLFQRVRRLRRLDNTFFYRYRKKILIYYNLFRKNDFIDKKLYLYLLSIKLGKMAFCLLDMIVVFVKHKKICFYK